MRTIVRGLQAGGREKPVLDEREKGRGGKKAEPRPLYDFGCLVNDIHRLEQQRSESPEKKKLGDNDDDDDDDPKHTHTHLHTLLLPLEAAHSLLTVDRPCECRAL